MPLERIVNFDLRRVSIDAERTVPAVRGGERDREVVEHLDDFTIALATPDGGYRSFRIDRNTPKIEIHDPLEGHRQLLPTYRDQDIHNVTAYLVTLK